MTARDRYVGGFGVEYVADIYGCDPDLLQSCERLNTLVARLIRDIGIHPLRDPVWHKFPDPGGITGLWLLTESHLTLHTFPEGHFAAVNLYSCGSKGPWAWDRRLREWFEADHVDVRTVERGAKQPSVGAPPDR